MFQQKGVHALVIIVFYRVQTIIVMPVIRNIQRRVCIVVFSLNRTLNIIQNDAQIIKMVFENYCGPLCAIIASI